PDKYKKYYHTHKTFSPYFSQPPNFIASSSPWVAACPPKEDRRAQPVHRRRIRRRRIEGQYPSMKTIFRPMLSGFYAVFGADKIDFSDLSFLENDFANLILYAIPVRVLL